MDTGQCLRFPADIDLTPVLLRRALQLLDVAIERIRHADKPLLLGPLHLDE
jgi:hypothetical protein